MESVLLYAKTGKPHQELILTGSHYNVLKILQNQLIMIYPEEKYAVRLKRKLKLLNKFQLLQVRHVQIQMNAAAMNIVHIYYRLKSQAVLHLTAVEQESLNPAVKF